jgi:hypothetical protein
MPSGLLFLFTGWFVWCLTYVGAVLGGMFTAAMARHDRVRHAGWAGIMMGVLSLVWPVLVLSLRYLLQAVQHPKLGWPGVGYFFSGLDRWTLLSVLLQPLAFLAGGALEVGAMRGAQARESRLAWKYETADGRVVTAQTPWHHRGLAQFWSAAAGFFFATCCLTFAGGALLAKLSRSTTIIAAGLSSVIPVVQCAILALACRALARKHQAESVGEILARDTRPPVLYLRSFLDDGRGRKLSVWRQLTDAVNSLRNKTHEQRLAKYAEGIGPFVAIGRPGEELPELGAARMYVSNDDWQAVATDLMARSQLVVLQVGETRGVQWELDRVDEVKKPEQVLLFTPFGLTRDRSHRECEYAAFREWGRTCLPGEFPAEISNASFLYFEPEGGWKSRALTYKGDVAGSHPRAELLRKLARDKAFRPEPLIGLFGWILIVILSVFGLFLLLVLLAVPLLIH